MPEIIDDKSEHCIPFILQRLKAHRSGYGDQQPPPFFLSLNGVQGAGKTTLVSTLCNTLRSAPYNLPTVVLSIDDFYLPHAEQVSLAQSSPDNALVQHRGQPSTHDLPLAISVFSALRQHKPTKIPVYDKSAFQGQGDRTDASSWHEVNRLGEQPTEVVVFEGWCVGFRPLSDAELERKWADACEREKQSPGASQLGKHQFESVKFVNDALKEYDALTDSFNAFIQLDAEDTQYVYQWRLEQEAALRASKGTGMSDEQVHRFVDGYYPAYELYTDTLRAGIFGDDKGKQLRLVLGRDRRVKSVEII